MSEDETPSDGSEEGSPEETEEIEESGSEEPTEEPDEAASEESADEAGANDAEEDQSEPSGDQDDADEDTDDERSEEDTDREESEELTEAGLIERLDDAEATLEAADTESDLDAVEEDLDSIEEDIDAADLPEPDDEDDEDAEDPREELESRLSDLRDDLEDQRGPYAEDAVESVEDAAATIEDTEWTENGEGELVAPVEGFVDSVNEILGTDLTVEGEDPASLVTTLESGAREIDDAALDPDEDAETIAALLEATDDLRSGLDAAEEWDDLTVREKLAAQGFYDVLDHRKDFPPEWHALKVYEKRGEPEPILLALDTLGSEFMERHCLEALSRMGPEEALDAMTQRANKRDRPAIEVLGKIASDEPIEMLLEYAEADSDPQLQLVTLKSLGEIGSEDATQTVADRLTSENSEVRSRAARSLGLIGDTRAISPLSDVLENDDSDTVRASAAWALNQIGTRDALDAVSPYADDRAFLVQAEAQRVA